MKTSEQKIMRGLKRLRKIEEEEGRRKKEEGRRKKEEGRRQKAEGRRKEEGEEEEEEEEAVKQHLEQVQENNWKMWYGKKLKTRGSRKGGGQVAQTRRYGKCHKAVRQTHKTWRMTSQKPLRRKFKNWAWQEAKTSPGAGRNRMMAMAREVFQRVTPILGVSWKSNVAPPYHVLPRFHGWDSSGQV